MQMISYLLLSLTLYNYWNRWKPVMMGVIFSTFILIFLVHFGVYGTLCNSSILALIDYMKPGKFTAREHKFKRWFSSQKPVFKISIIQKYILFLFV